MTEKKEEDWKKEISEIVDKAVKEALKLTKEVAPLGVIEEKHEHWKAEDLLNPLCPQCKIEEQKLMKMLKKKDAEANKNLEYECVECGTYFGKKEKRCPECGNTRVRTI